MEADMTTATPSPADRSLDWLVSVDDHVVEPPGVWVDRVPARYRDAAPHVERDERGEVWVYEGIRGMTGSAINATVHRDRSLISLDGLSYAEMAPGCYDPVARLADMDEGGILASLNFPSAPRFCGQLFLEGRDKELGLMCLQAWNDWMVDEWCATAPGRFIPLTLIPLWDPVAAAAEIERCAAKGVTTFSFPENPAPLGLPDLFDPDRYWDPVLAAANDTEMVVSMHIGSSSVMPKISPGAPFVANMTYGASRTAGTMLAWLFSGHFTRYPKLKISLAEGNIGWIPYFLERAQYVWERQRYWVERGQVFETQSADGLPHGAMPEGFDYQGFDIRQLYLDHVYGCFLDDRAGLKLLDEVGEDNVMVEVDYPHSDTTWPHSMKLMGERLAGLTEDQQFKILRGNAQRLFRFTPADPPAGPR
jgi:predicted TIM-barrel fold metal-dependent hydrolase